MKQHESTTAELIEDQGAARRELERPQTPAKRAEDFAAELHHVFNQSIDPSCIAGFDGYLVRLNPAWTTMFGWTAPEIKNKRFVEIVHPSDREATRAELAKLAAGATTVRFENRCRHQNGSHRWLRWTAHPAPGHELIYAKARDVTGEHRLEREILEIADLQKERLGRDLHDGLCQTLAGIAALSTTLSRRLAASSQPDASAAAAEIAALVNESISEARDLARGLGPIGLQDVSLADALASLTREVDNRFRVACTFECDGRFPGLGDEVEAHLLRLGQEALSNAVNHGRPDRIEVHLSGADGQGRLSVLDDGVGLPEEALRDSGSGLRTMAYRARVIHGSLEVLRRSPRGTVITCVFPLPETSDSGETLGGLGDGHTQS